MHFHIGIWMPFESGKESLGGKKIRPFGSQAVVLALHCHELCVDLRSRVHKICGAGATVKAGPPYIGAFPLKR